MLLELAPKLFTKTKHQNSLLVTSQVPRAPILIPDGFVIRIIQTYLSEATFSILAF